MGWDVYAETSPKSWLNRNEVYTFVCAGAWQGSRNITQAKSLWYRKTKRFHVYFLEE